MTEGGDAQGGGFDYKDPTEQFLEKFLPIFPFAKDLYAQATGKSTGGGGGQFTFDLDKMREVKAEFEAERDRFERMLNSADYIKAESIAPAEDAASMRYAQTAADHFQVTWRKAVKEQYDYADMFCQALAAALGERQAAEDDIGGSMRDMEGLGL